MFGPAQRCPGGCGRAFGYRRGTGAAGLRAGCRLRSAVRGLGPRRTVAVVSWAWAWAWAIVLIWCASAASASAVVAPSVTVFTDQVQDRKSTRLNSSHLGIS